LPIALLTDVRVRGAIPPATGRLELWDAKTNGLCLRVTPNGRKTWTFRYRPTATTRRRAVLGHFPSLGLADARAAAERLRLQVHDGKDPQAERRDRREAQRAALTFDGLCDAYLDHAKRHKASWKNDEGYLRANCRLRWGSRAAAAIGKPEVAKLLLDLAARSPTSANRLRSVLVTMFTWAVDNALLETSPMVGIKKPAKENLGKTRVLRDDELRVFWNALDNSGLTAPVVAALRVILLCGQRPNEVAGMARDELVDFDQATSALWSIPASRMKGRRPHLVPVTETIREIVRSELERQREAGARDPEHVFASRSTDRTRLARHSLSQAMRRLTDRLVVGGADRDAIARLKTDPPTPHDLRRTAATGMSKLGIPREDRLAVLAHSHDDVHGAHYDQYDRLNEKRIALATWERHVLDVLGGAPARSGKVVALRRKVSR
jgi:integrase